MTRLYKIPGIKNIKLNVIIMYIMCNKYELRLSKNDSNDAKHPFQYVLNPGESICEPYSNKVHTLVALVPTRVGDPNIRLLLRQTLARDPKLKVVFLVGLSNDDTINQNIKNEYDIYKDIIQESFIDTYSNLTHKTVMALRWVSKYCMNSKFIIKIDEDYVLNTRSVLKYLNENSFLKNTFLCQYNDHQQPIRDPESKWYLPFSEYLATCFPPFCFGIEKF